MVTLVHTSDIHIGKVFEQFGSFGNQLRAQIKKTFRSVALLAQSERAAAVLISGDLFDTSSPSPNDIRFFLETVSSIRPLPVFLLPGTWTHDSFKRNCFYRSGLFLNNRPENLIVFSSEQPEKFKLSSGSVTIHGRAVLRDSGNPLDGINADPQSEFNVCMLHAGISLPQVPADEGEPTLTMSQVEQCGMDYLALGHWHIFQRYFNELTTIVQYSGSPETLQFKDGEKSGFATLVTLGDGRVSVVQKQVGHYRWMEIELDCGKFATQTALVQEIVTHADVKRVLRVKLKGSLAGNDVLNLIKIREELGAKFAHLDIDESQLREDLAVAAIEKEYREHTVERAFVTLVEKAIEETKDSAEIEALREVLLRGHKLFQGHEGVSS